jgi:uncharacterized protein YjgD (DUF1641 family)
MAYLNKEEKEELLKIAKSSSLREDMEYLLKNRHNPVVIEGEIDLNRLVEFLTEFNEFINHEPKPFRRIIDKNMKL